MLLDGVNPYQSNSTNKPCDDPKHGSWLNVAEVELSVMIRQCLNRRIASIKVLRDEVAAWQASRDRIQAKVNWQFTTDDARVNLKRLYPTFDE